MKVCACISVYALLTGLLSLVALADTVLMKNGRTMEGLITDETDTHVVLDMGLGTVKLKTSSINAITRSRTNEAAGIQDEWKARYYDRDQYAPAYGVALAKQLRGAEGAARQADVAVGRLKHEAKMQRQLTEQVSDCRKQLAEALTALEGLNPQEDGPAYNKMVGTANRYNGQALKAQQSLEASLKRVKTERATVAEFLAAYDKLQTQYKHAYAKFMAVGAPDEDRHFFDAVEARLEGLAARMKSTTVPYARKGNQAMVKTRINDMGEAHLLLDTGASLVTLSEIAARRLGVSLSGERTVTLTLANGSTVTAEPVVLASVQVGEARVENVPAAVLDSEDAGEMDGLLGMSFLQAFRVHINGADGGLELEMFE